MNKSIILISTFVALTFIACENKQTNIKNIKTDSIDINFPNAGNSLIQEKK